MSAITSSSEATPYSCIPSTMSIMRKSDSALLDVKTRIFCEESVIGDVKQFTCTCGVGLSDESWLGWIVFSVPVSSEDAAEINYIDSPNKLLYRGIGTALVNIAIKCSKVFSNGKVKVYSMDGSVGFYHKLGFGIDWDEYKNLSDSERETLSAEYLLLLEKSVRITKCIRMILS